MHAYRDARMCLVTYIYVGVWKSPFGTQILYEVLQGYQECEACWSFATEFRSQWHTASKTFFTFSFPCSAIGQRQQTSLGLGVTSSRCQALGYGAQQSLLCCAHLTDLTWLCLYPDTLRWMPPGCTPAILEGDNAAMCTMSICWALYQPPLVLTVCPSAVFWAVFHISTWVATGVLVIVEHTVLHCLSADFAGATSALKHISVSIALHVVLNLRQPWWDDDLNWPKFQVKQNLG